ncbi:hypothetical protein GUJ93_ZPchr0012g21718 [Zizania palustris]|uniref:Uncharacterized protein n=1 Tax=Zizania palustris TaxID=103762 RepID=A0A8J5WU92_ZIZPA|nr:hypothetical protein GUJ93_ZPchr0012g21718 [Zizania palustris]
MGESEKEVDKTSMDVADEVEAGSNATVHAKEKALVCLNEMEKWADVIIPAVEQSMEDGPLSGFEQVNKGKHKTKKGKKSWLLLLRFVRVR